MIAFTEDEVFLKSPTFEELLERTGQLAPSCAEEIESAVQVGCLWVDDLDGSAREAVVTALLAASRDMLGAPPHVADAVREAQLGELVERLTEA